MRCFSRKTVARYEPLEHTNLISITTASKCRENAGAKFVRNAGGNTSRHIRINSAHRWYLIPLRDTRFHENHCDTQLWARAAHWLQPSTLRGTVNEYQPYGGVIIPVAMGECSAYSSLQADSKVKFAAWPASWRPPGTDRLYPRWTTVNSRIWLEP